MGESCRGLHSPGVFHLTYRENRMQTNRTDWAEQWHFEGIAISEQDYHVWGTSPMEGDDGRIHLFVARWPVAATFDPGWRRASEIARYHSDRPEGPYCFGEVVLKGTGKETWDHSAPHNPSIKKIGAKSVLLYIANDGVQHRRSQKIGMAIASSPEGPWEKVNHHGLILSPPEDPGIWCHQSCVGVNNPTLLVHPDGRFFLYFKAKVEGDVHRMGLAIAEYLEGPYVIQKVPITRNGWMIEDGYAFLHQGTFHLLTTDCQEHQGLLWSSGDGLVFDSPALGYGRLTSYLSDEQLKRSTFHRARTFERPQLLIQRGTPTYLYVASGVNISGGRGSCSYRFRAGPHANL